MQIIPAAWRCLRNRRLRIKMFVLSVVITCLSEGMVSFVGRKLMFLPCSRTKRSATFVKNPLEGRFDKAIFHGQEFSPPE
jgi:hypothetical protein